MNRKNLWTSLLALSVLLSLSGCTDDDEPQLPELPTEEEQPSGDPDTAGVTEETYYATYFAQVALESYYVWNAEIAEGLKRLAPDTCAHPVQVVQDIRYKDTASGIEDKWTYLTDDLNSLVESTQGTETTYGFLYKGATLKQTDGRSRNYMVVALVYADSPAAKAGLKRGDLIAQINGKDVDNASLKELFYSPSATIGMGRLQDGRLELTGTTHALTAVKMYTNPLLYHHVFDVNGKKVGYLCYSSFDLKSVGPLIDRCRAFKAEGVSELILDLRYNGGGYVLTEVALASMLAPEAVAHNPKAVFEQAVYNQQLTKYYKEKNIDTSTYFQTSWNYTEQENGIDFTYDTTDANIGLQKIYGLITANSASASEALLGGLMPYMDVEIIGTPSHGKYCTGIMLSPDDLFSKYPSVIQEWGIYVMVSLYQNAKGETPCMPNGLVPDRTVEEGVDLVDWGDENDPLLRAALESAGKVYTGSRAATRPQTGDSRMVEDIRHNAAFGKRIALPIRPLERP